MDDYINISTLNDFIFCPYSIYLHNVYMDTDEGLYHATPQTKGKVAHKTVDNKTASHLKTTIVGLPVYSEKYKLMGKIDIYRGKEKLLVERKYQLKQIFQGQIYQLWAQMFCMQEMGYEVEQIAFYETSTNKTIPAPIPDEKGIERFAEFVKSFQDYNPTDRLDVNPNKCRHCIYCNLCDKTEEDNVYQ